MTADITRIDCPPWSVWVVNTGTATYPVSALYPALRHLGGGDTVDVPNNAVILHDGEHLVLLDTGLPADPDDDSDAAIVDAMRELGLAPESVDAVILSHLHPDHLGPLLSQRSTAEFPHARFYLHRNEWTYFSEARNLQRHQGRVADAVRIALPVLAQSQLVLFDEPCAPFPGLRVRLADGHTPGHCITDIGTPVSAVYIADLVAQQRQLDQLALASGFDQAHRRAQQARVAELRNARETRARIIASHISFSA